MRRAALKCRAAAQPGQLGGCDGAARWAPSSLSSRALGPGPRFSVAVAASFPQAPQYAAASVGRCAAHPARWASRSLESHACHCIFAMWLAPALTHLHCSHIVISHPLGRPWHETFRTENPRLVPNPLPQASSTLVSPALQRPTPSMLTAPGASSHGSRVLSRPHAPPHILAALLPSPCSKRRWRRWCATCRCAC